MSTIHQGKILKELVELSDKSVDEIAKSLGRSRNYVYELFKMENLSNYYLSKLKESGFDIENSVNVKLRQKMSYDPEHNPNRKGVPYLGEVDVFAGKINISVFSDYKEYITDWFDLAGFRGCDCFINVSGDSMESKYCDKDVIGIMKRNDWRILDFGKPHIIVTDEVPLFKFLHRTKTANHWLLKPGNKNDYDEFEINIKDVRALFFVKGKIQIRLS